MNIKQFVDLNFRHFNAAALKDAAEGYVEHMNNGGKMFLAMAGAMSTAELGITLAEMIREGKIHAISTTGANLEEDIYNLVAHDDYKRIPNYRELTPIQEQELRDAGWNRVTDTCIPEETAIRKMEHHLLKIYLDAEKAGERFFPYQYMYKLLKSGVLEKSYQIDPKHSWMLAAAEKNIPVFTGGWEDSTCGNIFVSHIIKKQLASHNIMKSGTEQMQALVDWYLEQKEKIGFFQIGGGIAGDFPICVVPLIQQDLQKDCNFWSYFCQISDSTTSYGSYSGATPNEKITWGKLEPDTPRYIVESDATIVAPLIFQYVLDSCATSDNKENAKAVATAGSKK
ncbi:MAG: deoxyhypusine synthase family protein [Candidatus Melainabacteria bacterium]|nr:MAG: deoxyhypusine synthase family protein [Candidatus Melainabacteria bacterium]